MVRQTEARAPRRCLAKKKEALLLPYFLILAADVVEEYFAASKAAATDEGGAEDSIMVYFLLTPSKKWQKSKPNNCPCHSSKIWPVRKWSTKLARSYDDRWSIMNLGKFKTWQTQWRVNSMHDKNFTETQKPGKHIGEWIWLTRQTHRRVSEIQEQNGWLEKQQSQKGAWESSSKWSDSTVKWQDATMRCLFVKPWVCSILLQMLQQQLTAASSAYCWRQRQSSADSEALAHDRYIYPKMAMVSIGGKDLKQSVFSMKTWLRLILPRIPWIFIKVGRSTTTTFLKKILSGTFDKKKIVVSFLLSMELKRKTKRRKSHSANQIWIWYITLLWLMQQK